MASMNETELYLLAVKTAIEAGEAVLQIYNSEYSTSYKSDNSPLTTADLTSHQFIVQALTVTSIPILSEEGTNIPWETRKHWASFWLVDPLDGTKEFINRNGEFTINIALVQDGYPIFGVIYVPVSQQLYFGSSSSGSYRIQWPEDQKPVFLAWEQLLSVSEKLPLSAGADEFTILASRSHLSSETERIIEDLKQTQPHCKIVNAGSSLKFCRLAEGSAHFYPRFGPTMCWDTAAGQAIAENSDIKVLEWPLLNRLHPGSKDLLNPWFIAFNPDKVKMPELIKS